MRKLNADPARKIAALRSCSYFAGLSEEILEELAQGTSLRQYSRGEVVLWDREPCSGLFILEEGSVKLVKHSQQGRELILRVLGDGATFNEVPVFDEGPNAVTVIALENSRLWVIQPQNIQRALEAHPEMNRVIISNLTQNLRRLVEMVEELSFYQVTNRLARLISGLQRDGHPTGENQRLTQAEMAAHLGTVREVVARSLRELERTGAIRVNRSRIQILNDKILQQWAQGPD